MIISKYNFEVDEVVIKENLHRLINLTFKLLPMREEGMDWRKPLQTILVELSGMSSLLSGQQNKLFTVICKLQGILSLDCDYQVFRRFIFESINILSQIQGELCQESTD